MKNAKSKSRSKLRRDSDYRSNVSCSNFKYTKTKATFQPSDTNGKMDWRRKQNVIHSFLRVTLLEDGIEKEWSKFGQNPQILIEAQDLLTKLEWF